MKGMNTKPPATGLPPRFTIGRDHHGWWVVHDRTGMVGGLFRSEDAARHFAVLECDRHPEEIGFAPASTVIELGTFTSDAPATPPLRATRARRMAAQARN